MDASIAAWAHSEASKHSEIQQFIMTDAKGDFDQQISDVKQLIAQKVNLIIVNPVEKDDMSAFNAVLDSAAQANISLILVNHHTTSTKYATFIGPDEFKVGCIMTQELVTALNGEGVILQLTGLAATLSDTRRRDGAVAIFNIYPAVSRVAVRNTTLKEGDIRAQVDLVNSNRIDGLWAYNGYVGQIAVDEAIKQGIGQLITVGGDQSAGLAKINAQCHCRTSQIFLSTKMGSQAVQVALDVLQGRSIQKFIEVPVGVIPSSTLGNFNLNIPDSALIGDEPAPEGF
jgi:ABC-type sugar transport system substrate-binding protein